MYMYIQTYIVHVHVQTLTERRGMSNVHCTCTYTLISYMYMYIHTYIVHVHVQTLTERRGMSNVHVHTPLYCTCTCTYTHIFMYMYRL